jgi:photosystem II stability/assembly factor-like uncharacterized protein
LTAIARIRFHLCHFINKERSLMAELQTMTARLWLTLVFATALFGVVPRAAAQPQYDGSLYAGLRWRMVGPFRGGRVNGVTGVPGQPNTFYFGSVGGGLWKSTNAGRAWSPIFDSQPIASIGAIAVAPSNPNFVYVGTGETDVRSQISFGNGVYKSTDAGKTWAHIGLDNTRHIGRVLVDPKNPNLVFVAALGHVYGPNPDRGVFRSRDGGVTWEKVLFKNEDVGAADLAFDPQNSQVIYASLWATRRTPWSIYPPSYGPGGGLYKSTNGGTTWQQLTGGLPTEKLGRIGIATAPTKHTRVYAIVDAKEGGLYRSDDAGATWVQISKDNRIWGRGWYFCKIAVDPKNADLVYVPNTALYRSQDGGKSWTAIKGAPGGDDYQELWIYPDDPSRMIVGSDQGAVVSVDGGATWSSWYNQPTAQLYHVAADNRFPYWLTGAQQDSGAVGTPSRSNRGRIWQGDWVGLCAGGESGYTAPDPLHPDILFGDTVTRCNLITGETKSVSPERGMSEPPRHTWTMPLVFSKADPHALYFSNQFLFRTTNGGESWAQISADLTREDPGVPPNLDQAAAANSPPGKRRGVIYTIAPSPLLAPTVWVGTDDGLINLTRDGGKSWKNVTPPELTSWSKVVMIQASHFDVDTAYAAIDRHRLADNEPYIYRTRDGGKTWQKITAGLPANVYVQTVEEDPERRGLLFAGTELGVFVSFDDGDRWQSIQLNLPPCSMRDLDIHGDDLIVATHGRGFWVLDDLTVLRQINDEVAKSDTWLFRPADAYDIPRASENGTPLPLDEPVAMNPPYGAMIDYYLKSAASGPVTIEILDAAGETVRRYSSEDRTPPVDPDKLSIAPVWRPTPEPVATSAGMHRWVWDLRPTPTGERGRGATGGGEFGDRRSAAVFPGTYVVRLTVSGNSYTQPLRVRMDPRAK